MIEYTYTLTFAEPASEPPEPVRAHVLTGTVQAVSVIDAMDQATAIARGLGRVPTRLDVLERDAPGSGPK